MSPILFRPNVLNNSVVHNWICSLLKNSSLIEAGWQWIESSLVHIMTCHLFNAKPLSEPMFTCYHLDAEEHISMKVYLKFEFFFRRCIWKYHLWNESHFVVDSNYWITMGGILKPLAPVHHCFVFTCQILHMSGEHNELNNNVPVEWFQ